MRRLRSSKTRQSDLDSQLRLRVSLVEESTFDGSGGCLGTADCNSPSLWPHVRDGLRGLAASGIVPKTYCVPAFIRTDHPIALNPKLAAIIAILTTYELGRTHDRC